MTNEMAVVELTDEQQGRVCGILSVGCDRQTAAHLVGCSVGDIGRAMRSNPRFAADVAHAEASCELNHMHNVQQAAKEKANWRASVWWLECRSPERYGKRGAGEVTARQLKAFVSIVADVLSEEIRDEADRGRLRTRLQSIEDAMDRLLRDADSGQGAAAALISYSGASDNGQPPSTSDGTDEGVDEVGGGSW